MKQWYRILDHQYPVEDGLKVVMAGEKAICFVCYQGQYYALDNVCPHQQGSLGEGTLEDGYIVCPVHGWQFSPFDGTMPDYYQLPPTRVFPVEVRDDGIYVYA